jgi:hypothetical protein
MPRRRGRVGSAFLVAKILSMASLKRGYARLSRDKSTKRAAPQSSEAASATAVG